MAEVCIVGFNSIKNSSKKNLKTNVEKSDIAYDQLIQAISENSNVNFTEDQLKAFLEDCGKYPEIQDRTSEEPEQQGIESDTLIEKIHKEDAFLNDRLDRYFGQTRAREELFSEFQDLMVDTCIIDEHGVKTNAYDINEGIEQFLEKQWEVLTQFLNLENIGQLFNGHERNSKFQEVIDQAHEYFYKNTNPKSIEQQWIAKKERREHKELAAVTAFLYLDNFEDFFRKTFKKLAKIEKSQRDPIEVTSDNVSYKYTFAVNVNNLSRGWSTNEQRNGIDEIGNVGKLLLSRITKLSYETGQSTGEHITVIDAVNAVNSLLEQITQREISDFDSTGLGAIMDRLAQNNFIVDSSVLQFILQQITQSDYLMRTLQLTRRDKDTLYSLYTKVYDKENPDSYYNVEERSFEDVIRNGNSPVQLISNALTNVSRIKYLHTRPKDGKLITETKRIYNVDQYKFDFIDNINNNAINLDVKTLIEKFTFKYEPILGSISFTSGESEYVVNTQHHALSKSDNFDIIKNGQSLMEQVEELSTDLNDIEIFLNKNQDTIEFISAALGISFNTSDNMMLLKEMMVRDPKSFIGLLRTAVRSGLIQNCYKEYNKLNDNTDGDIGTIIDFADNYKTFGKETPYFRVQFSKLPAEDRHKYYKQTESETILLAVTSSEHWLQAYSNAKQYLSGAPIKSVVSDALKNKLPHYSPKFMATDIQTILASQTEGASSSLFFVQGKNRSLIKSVCVDTEVILDSSRVKKVRDMSNSELNTHAIIDKFALPLSTTGTFYVQPTTYSDKPKFINFEVDGSLLISDEANAARLLKETIGNYYSTTYNNVIQDLAKVFGSITSIAQLNTELSKYSKNQLYNLAQSKGITLYENVHFRSAKGKLQFNEFLYEMNQKFQNESEIINYIQQKKLEFLNRVFSTYTVLPYSEDIYRTLVYNDTTQEEEVWHDGLFFFPARINGQNVKFSKKLDSLEGVQINPLLEKYFYTQMVYATNIRYSLTGSEVNIPIKQSFDIESDLDTIKAYPKELDLITRDGLGNKLRNLTLSDVREYLDTASKQEQKTARYSKVKQYYSQKIGLVTNEVEMALLKRNVAIPATITPYTQNDVKGITQYMKVAVLADPKIPTYGFDGKTNGVDVYDGGGFMSPIQNRLEQFSLGENSGGSVTKPILHWYDNRFGTAILMKYATFADTNKKMLMSGFSKNAIVNRFKKMHNLKFSENFGQQINLCDDDHQILGVYRFSDLTEGSAIFYSIMENGTESNYEIQDFNKEELNGVEVYTTLEAQVTQVGNYINNDRIKRLHLFNKNSEHIVLTQTQDGYLYNGQLIQESLEEFIQNNKLHTVDSLYELWEVFGGMYSKSIINGKLNYSEASISLITNFVINYGEQLEESEYGVQDARRYNQPLKEMFIGCAVMASAIKRGAGNVNPLSSLYSKDGNLSYIQVGTQYYGKQQDSDHTADEAEASEPSQVITALDINGYNHEIVKEIFEAIADQSRDSISREIEVVQNYIANGQKDKSEVYEAVSKILMSNLDDEIKESFSLLIKAAGIELNTNVYHIHNEHQIPFSNPQLYGILSSTIASNITKRAIKRRYTGIADVLCPSYDMITYYQIDGQKMLFQDVIQEAQQELQTRLANKEEIIGIDYSSIQKYNDSLVNWYLNLKQNEVSEDGKTLKHPILNSLDSFEPEANINIIINGNRVGRPITLNSLDNYYDFKFGLKNLQLKGITGLSNWNLTELNRRLFLAKQLYDCNITESTDYITLTATINGEVVSQNIPKDGSLLNGVLVTNQELADVIIGNIQYQNSILIPNNLKPQQITLNLDGKNISIFDLKEAQDSYILRTKEAREALRDIYVEISTKGTYHGKPIQIVKNSKAELIASNIYASKLGVSEDDTVFSIHKNKNRIFKTSISKLIKSTRYQMAFTKNNGDYVYISLNGSAADSKTLPFNRISKRKNGNNYDIYAVDENGKEIMLIGVDVKRTNCHVENGVIVDNAGKKITDSNYRIETNHNNNQDVFETRYFVTRQRIDETFKDIKGNVKRRRFEVYNFNSEQLKKIDPSKDVSTIIADSISKLYNYGEYKSIQINTDFVNEQQFKLTRNVLGGLSVNDTFAKNLRDLLVNTTKLMNQKVSVKNGLYKIPWLNYQEILKQYFQNMTNEKYNSFKASNNFVSSRIPAQCLQSFMAMELIGYSGVGTNEAYVSHFQTFLQGSDYDIDKSYILGYYLDENGIIQGWSNLFDATTEEALEASMSLPFPKGINYNYSKVDVKDSLVDLRTLFDEKGNVLNQAELISAIGRVLRDARAHNNTIKLGISGRQLDYKKFQDFFSDYVEKHESFQTYGNRKEQALKNFIVRKIQDVIQHPSNIISSYTAVSIDDMKSASTVSPKTKDAANTDIFNPLDIFLMQSENGIGKNSIGIGANGQKSSFSWMYYLNEMLKDPTNSENLKKALFNWHDQGRIIGRAQYEKTHNKADLKDSSITTIPSVNKDIKERLRKDARAFYLDPEIATDDATSQFISAATDNAKELILKKINAGGEFAKCYLFLVTMGYSYTDIVAFMTSPLIELMNNVTGANMYLDQFISLSSLIDLAVKWDEQKAMLFASKSPFHEFIVQQFTELLGDPTKQKNDEYIKDAVQLQQILKEANNFSFLGVILGINQGIKSKRSEALYQITKLGKLLEDASVSAKKMSDNLNPEEYALIQENILKFNPYEWLADTPYTTESGQTYTYRQLTADYYALTDCVINPYAIMSSIPHFVQMFDSLYTTTKMQEIVCAKDRMFIKISPQFKNLSDEGANQILAGIDNFLIYQYLIQSGLEFTAGKETIRLDKSGNLATRESEEVVQFKEVMDIINFKYYFENNILPMIQRGDYSKLEGEDIDLKDNPFINSLYRTEYNGIPMFRTDLDMLNINSPQSEVQFHRYVKGLQELEKIKLNGTSLLDWFAVYNLIVNKGKGGTRSLTKLFMALDHSPQVLENYNKFLSKLDLGNEDIDFTYEDIVLSSAKLSYNEDMAQLPAIKMIDKQTKLLSYKIRGKYNYLQQPLFEGVKTAKAQSRLIKYNPLGIFYDTYFKNNMKLLQDINDDNLDVFAQFLQQKIFEGKILIKEYC